MFRLPPKLSGTSREAAWFNRMRDYIQSLRPINSPNVYTSHGPRGVSRRAEAKGGRGGTTEFLWL